MNPLRFTDPTGLYFQGLDEDEAVDGSTSSYWNDPPTGNGGDSGDDSSSDYHERQGMPFYENGRYYAYRGDLTDDEVKKAIEDFGKSHGVFLNFISTPAPVQAPQTEIASTQPSTTVANNSAGTTSSTGTQGASTTATTRGTTVAASLLLGDDASDGGTNNNVNNLLRTRLNSAAVFGTNEGPCFVRTCIGIAESRGGRNMTSDEFTRLIAAVAGSAYRLDDYYVNSPVDIINEALRILGSTETVVQTRDASESQATILHGYVTTRDGPVRHFVEGDGRGVFRWDPSGHLHQRMPETTINAMYRFVSQ